MAGGAKYTLISRGNLWAHKGRAMHAGELRGGRQSGAGGGHEITRAREYSSVAGGCARRGTVIAAPVSHFTQPLKELP